VALECLGLEGITHLVGCSTSLESLNKPVVDTRLNIDSRTSTAALSVIEENTKVNPRNSVFDIGVVEDNIW
jgi:hypothetical protein